MYFFFPLTWGWEGGGQQGWGGGSQSGWQELKEMKSKKTIIGDRQLQLKGNKKLPSEPRMRSFKWKICPLQLWGPLERWG